MTPAKHHMDTDHRTGESFTREFSSPLRLHRCITHTQVPILMFYFWCHACSGFQWLTHSFSVIQSLLRIYWKERPSEPFYNVTILFDYSKSTLIIICSFLQDFDPLTVKRTNMVVQPLQRLQRHRKGGMNTTGNNSRGGRSKEKHLRFQKAHVRHIKWKKWVVLTGLTLSFTSLQSLLWLLPSPRRESK